MSNIKSSTFDKLEQSLFWKKDRSNVSESVKPFKLKPMNSLNRMKSFKPKKQIDKLKQD